MKVIGVDIGGTKIEAALIRDKVVTDRAMVPTPAGESADFVFEVLADLVGRLYSEDVAGIGIGVPGMVDGESGDIFDITNIPAWKKFPLKYEMNKRFNTAIAIDNDANCFATGEKYFGKGQSYTNFAGITIGTGLGTGLIINDHLFSGKYSGAGEFGAMPYLDKTIEAYASGQFFRDKNLDAADIAIKASNGDGDSVGLYNEFGMHLGRAINLVLFAVAPEAVILGGSLSKAYPLYNESLVQTIRAEFPYRRIAEELVIEISDLKDSAVIGAAALVFDRMAYENLS